MSPSPFSRAVLSVCRGLLGGRRPGVGLALLLFGGCAAPRGVEVPPPALGAASLPGASRAAPTATPTLAAASSADRGAALVDFEGRAYPATLAAARALRASGARYSNAEVRRYYLHRVASLVHLHEAWRRAGLGAEERARRSHGVRRDARLLARALMGHAAEVVALQARDLARYGHTDGPTFEHLVARARARGLAGDDVYEAMVASALRTAGGGAGHRTPAPSVP